jgi:hypothetical protein
MEWLVLILIAPAIIVLVVLLWGFAGCYQSVTLSGSPVAAPVNLTAAPLDVDSIRLTWTGTEPNATYQIERTPEGQSADPLLDAGANFSFDDLGLQVGTTYFYRVRAVRPADGLTSDWTAPSSAATFIFNGRLDPALGAGSDQPNMDGSCIVTRIAAMTPPPNPPRSWQIIKITLQGSTTAGLTINTCTISQPADLDMTLPPDQREKWDSLHPPQVIATNIVFQPGAAQAFVVNFPVDGTQDLLIAFDINPTPGQGNVRFGPLMQAPPPNAYFKRPNPPPPPPPPTGAPVAQAALQNRTSDFLPSQAYYLVDKIEVAE